MLDKARLTIIASVPLAMTFNLFLLNCYYYPRVESNNIQDSIKTITKKNYKEEKEIVYERKITNKSVRMEEYDDMIFKFSPPAPHTFIRDDSSSWYKEREAIKDQGIILE